jgi:hypothetical protein
MKSYLNNRAAERICLVSFLILILLALSACATQVSAPTPAIAIPTRAPTLVQTAALTMTPTEPPRTVPVTETPLPAPSPTSLPTTTAVPLLATPTTLPTAEPTHEPTVAPTATPPSKAIIEVITAGNLRAGPGTAYDRSGSVKVGEQYDIAGKDTSGQWWQIVRSDGSKVWIAASLAQVRGPVEAVAVVKDIPKPPQRAPTFGYGILADTSNLNQVLASTKDLGFGWLARQVPWKDIEPKQGNFTWSGLDTLVNGVNGGGVKLLLTVTKAPDWARPGANTSMDGPPEDAQLYAGFVGQLAKRYCGKVQAIEVWTHPNINFSWGGQPPDAGQYMALLKPAYGAIKAACPSVMVVSAALMPTPTLPSYAVDNVTYLDQMYQAGLKAASDAVGADLPGYNNPPDARMGYTDPAEPNHKQSPVFFFMDVLEGYRKVMVAREDGGKRIWVTNFGWPTGSAAVPGYEYAQNNTPDEQATYLKRAYEIGRQAGYVGAMFLWNLNYAVSAPDSGLALFSILDRNRQPLPAYRALKAMPK